MHFRCNVRIIEKNINMKICEVLTKYFKKKKSCRLLEYNEGSSFSSRSSVGKWVCKNKDCISLKPMFQKTHVGILAILTETMTSFLQGKEIFVTSSHRLSLEVPFSSLFNLNKIHYTKFIFFFFWFVFLLGSDGASPCEIPSECHLANKTWKFFQDCPWTFYIVTSN